MDKKYSYAAFFDLDGTLLNVNSGEVLVHMAYKKGHMKKKDLLQAFYLAFLYKFQLRETSKIIKKMPKWLAGLSEQEIADFTNKMFDDLLIHAIRPQMYREIEKHKQQNARIIILSAAFNYVCEPVARHLNIDDIICSRLEVVDGLFTGNTVGALCFDSEKLARVTDYCIKNNFSLEEACYYGDSVADSAVLDAVGKPKCVNPDRPLTGWHDKKNGRYINGEILIMVYLIIYRYIV